MYFVYKSNHPLFNLKSFQCIKIYSLCYKDLFFLCSCTNIKEFHVNQSKLSHPWMWPYIFCHLLAIFFIIFIFLCLCRFFAYFNFVLFRMKRTRWWRPTSGWIRSGRMKWCGGTQRISMGSPNYKYPVTSYGFQI